MKNIFIKSAIIATVLGLGTTFVTSATSGVYSNNEQKTKIATDNDFTNTEYGIDEAQAFYFDERATYGSDAYTPVETVRLEGVNSDYLFTHGRHTWKLLDLEGKLVNEGNFDSFEDLQEYKDWVDYQAELILPSNDTESGVNGPFIHNYVANYGFNTVAPMNDGNLFMAGTLMTDHAQDNNSALFMVAIFNPITGEFVDFHICNGFKHLPYTYEDTTAIGYRGYATIAGTGFTDVTTTNGTDFIAVGDKSYAVRFTVDYGVENDPTDDTIVSYYHNGNPMEENISTQINWGLRMYGGNSSSDSVVRLDDEHTAMLYYGAPNDGTSIDDYENHGTPQDRKGLVLISPDFHFHNNQHVENSEDPWENQHWFYFDELFPGEWTDSSNSLDSKNGIGLGIATKLVELPTEQTLVLGQHSEWMLINNSAIIEYFDGLRDRDQAAVKGVDYWTGKFNSQEKEEPKLTDAIAINDNKNIIFINEVGEWFLTDIEGNFIDQGYFGKYDNSIEEKDNQIYYGYSSIIDLGADEENPFNFYVSGATTSKVVSFDENGEINNIDDNINYEATYNSLIENNTFTLGETTYSDIEDALWDSLVLINEDVVSHDEWNEINPNEENANFVFYKDETTLIIEEDELVTTTGVNFKLVSNNKEEGLKGSTDLITIEGLLESEIVEPEIFNLKYSNISQTSATLTYDAILPEGFEFSYSKIVSATGEELYLGTNQGKITISDLKPNTIYSPSDSGIVLEVTYVDDEGKTKVLTEELNSFKTLEVTPTPVERVVIQEPIIEPDGTTTLIGNMSINDDLGLFKPETSNPLFEVDRTKDGKTFETIRFDINMEPVVKAIGAKDYIIEINGIDSSYTYSGARLSLTGDPADFVTLNIVDEYGNEVIERVTPDISTSSGLAWYWWLLIVVISLLILTIPVEAWFITHHHLMKKKHDNNPNHGCLKTHIRMKHGLRQEDKVITITQIIEHDDKDVLDIKGVIDFPKNNKVEAEDIKVKIGKEIFEIQLEAYHQFPNHFIFEIDGIDRKVDYTEIHISTDGNNYHDFEVNTSLLNKNKNVHDEDDSELEDAITAIEADDKEIKSE